MAKELVKQGCDVSICSRIGAPLANMAKKLGIKLYDIQEPPGFKKGDGQWLINGQNGLEPSKPNTIYKVQDVKFDILHLNHKPVTEHLLKFYPNVHTICTIHSEVLDLERPVVNEQIKKYDPECIYIKKWLPHLKNIDHKILYKWSTVGDTKIHPLPIFDHKERYQEWINMCSRVK